MSMRTGALGILVGGGPAPGINGVIAAAVAFAAREGVRCLGGLDGFEWLMRGDTTHVRELEPEALEREALEGGSLLRTSRANPTRDEEALKRVVKALASLGVDRLITIGGDDTAYSARRVAECAEGRIRVVHVPKTIDNDLPLPEGTPTFGFESARSAAAAALESLVEDCRTTRRWFVVVVMGRKAGHLALGAGRAARAPLVVIPEELGPAPLRLARVARLVEGAIVKRRALGREDGVAVVAEGVAEKLEPADLEALRHVEHDEHGHIRLAEVPLAHVLAESVGRELAARGVRVKIGEKDLGYELRCVRPVAYDRELTHDLGVGAARALLEGASQVMITRQAGRIVPIPFADLVDPATGRTRVRLVNTESDSYRAARALEIRLERTDLDDPVRLARIAQAAGLEPEAARERYAEVV